LAIAVCIVGGAASLASADRRFLDRCLLPPALIGGWIPVLGGAIGATFLSAANDLATSASLLVLQLVWFYSLMCFGIAALVMLRSVPSFTMPLHRPRFRRDCLRPLALLAWLFMAARLAQVVVGLWTGRMDRSEFGIEALDGQYIGLTPLELLPRLSDTGFLLAPCAWAMSRLRGRIILAGLAIMILALTVLTGSRGLVVRPCLFLLIGTYLFLPIRPSRLRLGMGVGAVMLLVLVPRMLNFRDSEAFQATPAFDIAERARIFMSESSSAASAEADYGKSRSMTIGTHLIGLSDLLVYEQTPLQLPFAGSAGLEHVWTAWIPQYLLPDRPTLMDGDAIAAEYRGYTQARTFATISFEADLFRRWGLLGVLIGVPIAAYISAMFMRFVMRTLISRDVVFGCLMLSILMSLFIVTPWSTVSWSAQRWLYDLPKHIIAAMFLAKLFLWLTGSRQRGGLKHYCFGP
jgi:hypothetical protein